jgi:NAD(P)-dependent dehydrogenase (short-subunit alcohol dehydrogenase family)
MNDLHGKVALVTGGSRGVGASTAPILAERGADVVINYRSKQSRAEEVAHTVITTGRRALLAQADITSESEMQAMMKQIEQQFTHLDLLILNASGGLEKDKGVDYAMQLNLTAQVRAVDLALPLMPAGGRIVFVTSHLAHFYGQKPVYPGRTSHWLNCKATGGDESIAQRSRETRQKLQTSSQKTSIPRFCSWK